MVAGCSAGTELDCEDVLGSHWSKWLGLPVSLLGVVAYSGILVLCWPAAFRSSGWAVTGLVSMSLLALGAALWFTALQVVNLESYCFYCLTVHGCSVVVFVLTLLLARDESVTAAAVRPTLGVAQSNAGPAIALPGRDASGPNWLAATGTAVLGIAALVVGQVFAEDKSIGMEELDFAPLATAETSDASESETPEAEREDGDSPEFLADDFKPVLQESKSRKIRFAGLAEAIDVKAMPIIGSPDAEHVFVEFVDYTCKHCRLLHPHVMAATEKYGDDLAVVVHHVPLNRKCNPHIKGSHPSKTYACDYAQLAIKVWLVAPEKFPEYHDWLMSSRKSPSVFEARKRALSLVGGQSFLDTKLDDEASERIRSQSDNLQTLDTGLPIMLFTGAARKGVPKDSEAFFSLLNAEFGLDP